MALNAGADLRTDWIEGGEMKGMGKSHEKTNVASFYMADSYLEDKKEEVVKIEYKKTIAVVILAGSFGSRLTREIKEDIGSMHKKGVKTQNRADARSGAGGDARHYGTHGTYNLRGAVGSEHVAKGMVKLADTTVFENMIIRLRQVDRLYPVEHNVYVVTNDVHLLEYQNVAKENDVQMPVENIISNGKRGPSEPVDKMADLQMAIEHFNITTPVLAISGDVAFFPDYNMSRIVEHGLIIKKDCCSYLQQRPGEHVVEPEGSTHAIVEVDQIASVSKCTAFHAQAPAGMENHLAAAPLFLLKAASLPLVGEYNAVSRGNGDMMGFMGWMSTKVDLYAIDLEFGYFDVKTLENLKFAEAFFEFYRMEKRSINAAMRVQDTDSSLVLKTEHSGMGDATKYDHSDTQVLGRGGMTPKLLNMCSDFIRRYFVEQSAKLTGKMDYKIPPTFYMTTYREQVAHAAMD